MSAFPAIAALMCCERHEQLVTTIDGFIDVLHKQLRERRIATMAILCLCRVVGCFIRRMSPRSDAGELLRFAGGFRPWLKSSALPGVSQWRWQSQAIRPCAHFEQQGGVLTSRQRQQQPQSTCMLPVDGMAWVLYSAPPETSGLSAGRMAKWLSRGVSPVIQAMVKGALAAPEQQELVRQLCATVAQHLPEYALQGMVLELLQVDLQAGMRGQR